MRELRKSLGLGGIALLSIACCVGLPLIAAAGLTVAAFTWIGGIAIGAVALAAVLVLLVSRIRTRHSCDLSTPRRENHRAPDKKPVRSAVRRRQALGR